MAFCVDRGCKKLIDFFYNCAELVSEVVWSVVATLFLAVFVIISPEGCLESLREIQIGYKVLICVLAVVCLWLLLCLLAAVECQKEQQIKQRYEILMDQMLAWDRLAIQKLQEELKKARQEVRRLEDEVSGSADSNKQNSATSFEDMHPDAVTARKYLERDPETLRRLSIFEP